ncbi:MAG: GerMN domain-containing protein [Thermoanaerobaculia bacterium]|nr:GerMN domain-containing protein [Thermoanaerobaculia bacterium]
MRSHVDRRRGFTLILLLLSGWVGACGGQPDDNPVVDDSVEQESLPTERESTEVTLYFPGESGRLYPEVRSLQLMDGAEGRTTALVQAFLDGPRSEALARPFDETIRLGSVYVAADGVAFVDLVSAESPNPPPSGSRLELQRVFGLVNSVVDNSEVVRGVVLLWNGRQRPAFSGHVDTGHVLTMNHGLVSKTP